MRCLGFATHHDNTVNNMAAKMPGSRTFIVIYTSVSVVYLNFQSLCIAYYMCFAFRMFYKVVLSDVRYCDQNRSELLKLESI